MMHGPMKVSVFQMALAEGSPNLFIQTLKT